MPLSVVINYALFKQRGACFDLFDPNNTFIYCLVAVVIVFVIAMSVRFIVLAWRRAKKLGISTQVLRRTAVSAAVFTIVPAISILLGVIALSKALGFPLPILLALLLNEVTSKRYKKLVQTITYAPHFLSAVVLVSIINAMFSTSTGIINNLIVLFGGEKVAFTTDPRIFKSLYVLSGVWQNMGWNSIIYMAALSGIDPTLYEAGRVDGASRWQMLWRITLPCLAPTICIMLILQCGRLMSLGYEKIYLMQNDLNIAASEVISTYVYKSGLINAEYSFSTAVGLFNSVINCILLFTVNFITGKLSDTRIF